MAKAGTVRAGNGLLPEKFLGGTKRMKKIIALLLALVMVFALVACSSKTTDDTAKDDTTTPADTTETTDNTGDTADTADTAEEGKSIKVGLVLIGDENDQGYTYNFMRGKEAADEKLKAEGINVEWVIKWNLIEGDPVAVANEELVEDGCEIIFNNSYGHEPAMLTVAAEYPDVQFVGMTNQGSRYDDLANTHNAFANIYEGRYVAGVAAGLKMQQLIDDGEITEDQAVIGYVGAYSFAEVVSGFTAYYLGARSVCPSATMKVQFVGSWSDATAEADAAKALIDLGCIVISQHSDNTTPATAAQAGGVYHTGYNNDMTTIAPDASIIGTRIDWTKYFVHAIECVVNGTELEQDWCKGMSDDEVVMTPLNEAIAAPGTAEKLAEVEEGIKNGTIQVFDTSTFTVDGKTVDHAFAVDTDGDFVADSEEAVFDGAFHESYFQSAPYFTLRIDGIEWINEAY